MTTTTKLVLIRTLKDDDIVVLGDTHLQLTEVDTYRDDGAVRLYFKGDVVGVNFHKDGYILRVEKPTAYPDGTVVIYHDGDVFVRRYGTFSDTKIHLTDEQIKRDLDRDFSKIIHTPKED